MSYTQYRDPTDTRRTPSPFIWADCPTAEIAHDPAMGIHFFDDFTNWEAHADSNDAVIEYGKYTTCASTGVTLIRQADTDFGVLEVAGNNGAEDGSIVLWGNDAGYARFGTGAFDQVWFEARFAVSNVTNDINNMFLGLIEVNAEPTSVITLEDGTGIPDVSEDFIGFSTIAADGNVVECIYQEGSATLVNVGDMNTAIEINTFYKVGLRYKRTGATTGKLDYILNGGIVQSLDVTSSLSFPDTNHLAMIWATKSTLGTEYNPRLDWWRIAAVGGNI